MGDYNRYGEKDARPGHFRQGGGRGNLFHGGPTLGTPSLGGSPEEAMDWSLDPRSEASHEDHSGKGPKGWNQAESILAQVNEALYLHPAVDASDIEAWMEGDIFVLSGKVSNHQQKKTAERLVENLSGIKDVRNEMRIKPDSQ